MSRAGSPTAGIVLAGGSSVRMGRPKATLEWRGATLLEATVATLSAAVDRVVVVAADGQALPSLPRGVVVARDAHPGRGPLEGLLAGLRALPDAPVAFVCAVDLPHLVPAFVGRVLGGIAPGIDAAVPLVDGRPQPLAAAYRAELAPTTARLLDDGERRVGALLAACRVALLEADDLLADAALRATDPGLESLVNVNTPAQLGAARAREGQRSVENLTTSPRRPASSSPTQPIAVAPASEVIA